MFVNQFVFNPKQVSVQLGTQSNKNSLSDYFLFKQFLEYTFLENGIKLVIGLFLMC